VAFLEGRTDLGEPVISGDDAVELAADGSGILQCTAL
jgi:hypothetical protein